MKRQFIVFLGGAGVWSLAACAPSVMGPVTMFADPAKYDYVTCEQLTDLRKKWAEREQDLKLLMDRAAQSTGGAVVNVIAYQTDYTTAQEEIKVIDATWIAKKCK
jgi:hypothetical protein